MHIRVEISNENGVEPIAGINEPIITQRITDSFLRMKDGEVGLLGGLSDKEQDNSISGFPGLTDIPVLGYLFGAKTKTKSDDEILVALIPHIVRAPDYTNVGDSGVFAGSEQTVHVHHRTVVTGDDGVDGRVDGKSDGSGNSPKDVPVPPPTPPGPPYTATPPPH
jgi:general secretion pathway protein D